MANNDAPPPTALPSSIAQCAERLDGSGKWPALSVDMATARVERLYHADGWCWCVTVEAIGTKGQAR